ncbi:MAG: hypothetical protein HYX78_13520 [Armatimonadetes bacterium]|nr:hypothetical protein [Armatimonadota bacterium]
MEAIASFIARHETAVTLWAGAIATLAIYSLLYKENPVYRLAEHIFIGLATGQLVYLTWAEVLKPRWWDVMVEKGQWWWAFALPVGLMFYFIYSKRSAWISRLIFGALMGLLSGMAFQLFANTYIPMVRGSFKPVIPAPGVGIATAANNLIFAAVLITVMAYFFFSVDHKAPAMRRTAALGRWFLMFAFGAMFGATVMARMALFIGRLDFMLRDWGPIVPGWFWVAAAAIGAVALIYVFKRPKPPTREEGARVPEAVQSEAVGEGDQK